MTLRLKEPANVLFRIKRGLAGYVSYLAACEMNPIFTEYLLYEPILRILAGREYLVECEYECPGIEQPKKGDKKRIDFVARKGDVHFALEVKWAKAKRVIVSRDLKKLQAFQNEFPEAKSFLCIFGRKRHIENLRHLDEDFWERGEMVTADFKKTRFSCRVFQMRSWLD